MNPILIGTDMVCIKDNIYYPESQAYKIIFLGGYSDEALKAACNHAVDKINKLIDELVQKTI